MKIAALLPIFGFATFPVFCADVNARDLVVQSIANYETDWKAAVQYTYVERDISKSSADQTKNVELYQVNVVDGTPLKRLIAKNGQPLDHEAALKESGRYQKALDARDNETPAQRARRIRKYDNERSFLNEIPNAFNMKLLGHETIGGRPNYVISLTPKQGYVPVSKEARIFPNIKGKLWIDEQDVRWTKAVADVIDTISFGWVLARIGAGAHITMTQEKVGEHWLPRKIEVDGVAKILLVKNRTIDETMSFENYKQAGAVPATAAARNR